MNLPNNQDCIMHIKAHGAGKGHVFYADGKHKTVKNLGWVLRHWREARELAIFSCQLKGGFLDSAVLIVRGDDWTYCTGFMSGSVAREWVARAVLRGLPLNYHGSNVTCGY